MYVFFATTFVVKLSCVCLEAFRHLSLLLGCIAELASDITAYCYTWSSVGGLSVCCSRS